MHGYCTIADSFVSDLPAPPIRQDGAQLLQLVDIRLGLTRWWD